MSHPFSSSYDDPLLQRNHFPSVEEAFMEYHGPNQYLPMHTPRANSLDRSLLSSRISPTSIHISTFSYDSNSATPLRPIERVDESFTPDHDDIGLSPVVAHTLYTPHVVVNDHNQERVGGSNAQSPAVRLFFPSSPTVVAHPQITPVGEIQTSALNSASGSLLSVVEPNFRDVSSQTEMDPEREPAPEPVHMNVICHAMTQTGLRNALTQVDLPPQNLHQHEQTNLNATVQTEDTHYSLENHSHHAPPLMCSNVRDTHNGHQQHSTAPPPSIMHQHPFQIPYGGMGGSGECNQQQQQDYLIHQQPTGLYHQGGPSQQQQNMPQQHMQTPYLSGSSSSPYPYQYSYQLPQGGGQGISPPFGVQTTRVESLLEGILQELIISRKRTEESMKSSQEKLLQASMYTSPLTGGAASPCCACTADVHQGLQYSRKLLTSPSSFFPYASVPNYSRSYSPRCGMPMYSTGAY